MSISNTYSPHLQFPWFHALVPWCLRVLSLISNWSCLWNGLRFPSWLRFHHKSQVVSEEHVNSFHIWFLSALSGVKKQETWRAACRGVMTMDSYPAGGGTNWTNMGIVWQEYWRGHWARSAFQILLCAHNFRDEGVHDFCCMFHVTLRILWRTPETCLQIPSRSVSTPLLVFPQVQSCRVMRKYITQPIGTFFKDDFLILTQYIDFCLFFSNKILCIKLFSVLFFVQNCDFELYSHWLLHVTELGSFQGFVIFFRTNTP